MRSRALWACALVLSACGGVPTTSQVHFTDDTANSQSSQYIRVIAQPPTDGMDAAAVVRGFLDACADPSSDFAVAREYLLAEPATQWKPETGVQVYDAAGMQVRSAGTTVTVSAPLQATISPDRHYTVLDSTQQMSVRFTLAKNGSGQLRIAEAPNGMLLSSADADRSYRPWVVYYAAKDLTRLVASSVVLPQTMQGAATALVQALLTAPPADLDAVATTAFPPGTRLTYGSVPVTGGVAEVDLSSDVLAADRSARRALTAQLAFTLQQLPTVGGVRLTVSGQQLTVPGISTVTKAKDWQPYAPTSPGSTLYVASKGVVSRVTAGETSVVARPAAELLGAVSAMTVDGVSGRIAAVLGSGSQLATTVDKANSLTLRFTGASLSRPTWDRDGTAYVADFGTGITAVPLTGKPYRVTLGRTTLGTVAQVKQVIMAPDGVRAVAVMSTGTADALLLGSVVRTKSTVSLTGLHRVDRGVGTVRDAVWTGPMSMQLLTSDATGLWLTYLNVATGAMQSSAAPPGSQSLAVDASGGVYLVVSGAAESTVVKRGFGAWTSVAAGSAAGFGP